MAAPSIAEARTPPLRSDSRLTRDRLVVAVGQWVAEHGQAPDRLADLAKWAGISVATAYRHFASIDDLIRAHVLRLPQSASERFARADRVDLTAVDRLHRWNRAWVRACLEFGSVAVHLRSADGFLRRRADGEPAVTYVCQQVEPLLAALDVELTVTLVVWNAVSDPREVLDLHHTLGWSDERIARFVTDTTLRTMDPSPVRSGGALSDRGRRGTRSVR
jgi:AcrR family transcriptional regulator